MRIPTLTRRGRALALAALAFGVVPVAACGPVIPPDDPYYSGYDPQPTGPTGNGKIAFAWTVQGLAPSQAACAVADHLTLTLDYGDGRVTISPVPCGAGKLRYDNLPEGDAQLYLDGYDESGCHTLGGSTSITVSTTLPDPFSPTVDLKTARGCR
jgi:hypothetical protein